MASGLPIITTEVPPMPEVVGEAAVLVPPSDPSALAAAIVKVSRNDILRASLAREGRRLVEARYLWKRVARQTLGHYESALSAKGGAA
jgi:glycosyltransferase involved in cell wall biosynthesis